ncbi:MAG: type I secretion protein [Rhodobacterales bacterium]|nr:MAG: type I secretion protein [Rhodobacterales bacterium]
MTFNANGTGPGWQPAGDYLLDWDLTGADGTARLGSASGGAAVGVRVSTPANQDCDAFTLSNGQLFSSDVSRPTISEITFDQPVAEVNFQLHDVDQGGSWDDQVTVRGYDPDGNLVEVDFTPLAGSQEVSGNQIEGEAPLLGEGIAVSVAGPVTKLVIVHDNGADAAESGYIRVSGLGFNAAPAAAGDGLVEGTGAADLIDTGYEGDPEGDRVDAGDALLPGETGDDDIIFAYGGDDTVFAGEGDDEVFAGSGNDRLFGEAGDDGIHGEGGDDVIFGGDGSDTVHGGAGNDVIDTSGTAPASDYGADLPGALYDIVQDPDRFNDMDFVDGGAGDDVIWTGDDADIVLGGAGNDRIDGGLDDDRIDGGTGNDTIIGGHGADEILGGAGNDTIWGGLGPGTDNLNIEDEDDPVWGIDDPRPDNGMDVIHGGAGNDTIFGQDDDDVLYGEAGNDLLDGGIDDDALFGGEGDDILTGGTGDDYLDGGAGHDVVFGGDDRDWISGVNAGDVVDGNEGGDDWDTLDLTGSASPGGTLHVTYTTSDQENGFVSYFDADGNDLGTLDFYNIEKVVPCFTPGTLIATPKGEVPVETLKPGDRVITRDNGIQQIRWVGARRLSFSEIARARHLAPVHICAGALGNGLPERDMMLSPNHRVLVANDRTSLYFDEREVLAAAKHLVDSRTIRIVQPMAVSYIHFMCDNHEVVLSNGAWSESFQPGDQSLRGVGNAQRQELFELFPELQSEDGLEDFTAARRILKKHEAQMLR